MLSKLLFNLTAVFLIFYISTTSAMPAAQPVELQKISDDIDPRAWRARPYRPYFCQYPYVWQRRECVPSRGPRAWQDVCTHANYASHFEVDYQNIQGTCLENTFCMNSVDEEGKHFVRCVRAAPGKRRREGPQVGSSSRKRARPTLDNTQLEFSVPVEQNMPAASVAAVVESECSTVNVHRRMPLCS